MKLNLNNPIDLRHIIGDTKWRVWVKLCSFNCAVRQMGRLFSAPTSLGIAAIRNTTYQTRARGAR